MAENHQNTATKVRDELSADLICDTLRLFRMIY